MHVITIPVLSDNYSYLIVDDTTKQCAAVDPAGPAEVLREIKARKLTLTSILSTHHHYDHAGGNSDLINKLPTPVPVYGGSSRVQAVSNVVKHGDTIAIGDNIKVTCLHTPCHTQDHICYYTVEGNNQCVFTGDTLFLGGCGRFFEGTADQMYHSLVEVLGKLPPATTVYCGHEYTANNLKFAKTVEPNNMELKNRIDACTALRSDGKPTVPGTIAEELATNPFMRVDEPSLQSFVNGSDGIDTMAIVRQMKDRF